jgi:hypothetical protein
MPTIIAIVAESAVAARVSEPGGPASITTYSTAPVVRLRLAQPALLHRAVLKIGQRLCTTAPACVSLAIASPRFTRKGDRLLVRPCPSGSSSYDPGRARFHYNP